jgi:hypothetical protein
MNNDPGQKNKNQPRYELRNIDDTYVFDAASGLYKPKSHESQEKRQNKPTHVVYDSPIHVRTGTDWYAAILSALTLLVVSYYTHVTAGILDMSQVAAAENLVSTNAARNSADTASKSLQFAHDQFRFEQRPYVFITDRGFSDVQQNTSFAHKTLLKYLGTNEKPSINVEYRNLGRSPAIHARATKLEVIVDDTNKALARAKKWLPKYKSEMDAVMFPSTQESMMFTTEYLPVIDQTLYDSLARGEKTIYVIGAVAYTDLLQPPLPPYETVFCYTINPNGVPFSPCPSDIRHNYIH